MSIETAVLGGLIALLAYFAGRASRSDLHARIGRTEAALADMRRELREDQTKLAWELDGLRAELKVLRDTQGL